MRQRFILGGSCLLVALAFSLSGCQPPEDKGTKPANGDSTAVTKAKPKHDKWWCAEHGIPEAECSMCDPVVEKECKATGDWCDKHDRAKSQCFKCDPSLKEKFAARYRAKYGKEPPPITEEEDAKEDAKRKEDRKKEAAAKSGKE